MSNKMALTGTRNWITFTSPKAFTTLWYKSKPKLFSSTASCVETLNNLYPYVQDVSSDEMLKAIRQALTKDGKFPLTLIVLDEVQQYIGEDSQRSNRCSGSGRSLLQEHWRQASVYRHRSDRRDRHQQPEKAGGPVHHPRRTLRCRCRRGHSPGHSGQEARGQSHPSSRSCRPTWARFPGIWPGPPSATARTTSPYFPQDYPILPVRRRFWENTLRVLDQTGTDSQLRNQLSMIHKVIQTNLDEPSGPCSARRLPLFRFCRQTAAVPHPAAQGSRKDDELEQGLGGRAAHGPRLRSCVSDQQARPAATTKSASGPPLTPWRICWSRIFLAAAAVCAASCPAC